MARSTVPNGEHSKDEPDASGESLGGGGVEPPGARPEAGNEAGNEVGNDDVLDANDPLIGQLKSLYDDVAAEPLPDRLMDLLAKLDEAERKR